MSASPIAAVATHHQPRPRLPFADARHGNNLPTQQPFKAKPQPAPATQPRAKMPPKEGQKQVPEPKKEKIRPPTPPAVIRDQKETLVFHKVGFLGEVCHSTNLVTCH